MNRTTSESRATSADPREECQTEMPRLCNIAAHLPDMATRVPDQTAVVVMRPHGASKASRTDHLSFAELERLSNRYANGLTSAGFARGMRVLLMVRPGIEFTGLVFALFKIGAVPVMIDPGMGVSRMLECIRQIDLQGFVGIPQAHALRVIKRDSFRTVEHVVTVGRRWFWGGPTLDGLTENASDAFDPAPTNADDTAAILFTSGSTGPAKGVVYEHGMFDAQVHAIQSCYGIEPGEIDLPTFPLFALFSVAMGMTCVVPDMDPSRPAHVDPTKIVDAVMQHGVTNTFGSPALWKRVASHCVERGIRLPTLRRILIAGAPVPHRVIQQLHTVLSPGADVHTPYGATESLPVSSLGGREILEDCVERSRTGAGTCVGKPLPGVELRIIRITDDPIPAWSDDLTVADGEFGEIVVAGPVVTKSYFGLEEATRRAKIMDGERIWHRLGDIGYRDRSGRLWFCGRKAHRVRTEQATMFTVPCEAIFNEHPNVARSALVGAGAADRLEPVIVVEPTGGRIPARSRQRTFRAELLELARSNELTRDIQRILFHSSLPVDVRHNAKINRERLAAWAAERIR